MHVGIAGKEVTDTVDSGAWMFEGIPSHDITIHLHE
jgi:hypothetical protein